jgi:aminopeptidase N
MTMRFEEGTPRTVHRSDYQPPDYLIDEVELHFDLGEDRSLVRSTLSIRRNPARTDASPDLVLDGEQLELQSISLDGRSLAAGEYATDDKSLVIPNVPARFSLVTEVVVHPEKNTALEGLYRSHRMFCTQCEAEGFRRTATRTARARRATAARGRAGATRSRSPATCSRSWRGT